MEVALVIKQCKEIEWVVSEALSPTIYILIFHGHADKFLSPKIFQYALWQSFYILYVISVWEVGIRIGGSSGNLKSNLGASDQQGCAVTEIGEDRMTGSESVETGFKDFRSVASSSGILPSLLRNTILFKLCYNYVI